MHWQELIDSPGVILADGAMARCFFEPGCSSASRPTVERRPPERVQAVHQAYLQAVRASC